MITSDIKEVNESGLELNIKPISDTDNGFINLEKASLSLYVPTQATGTTRIINELYSSNNIDIKLAQDIVTKNNQAILEFSLAAEKSEFQNPAYNDLLNVSLEMPLPKLNNWRTISHISSIKAQILLSQGKNAEAMAEAIKSVKVGQLITDSNVSLIEYLVGIAIKNTGLDSVEKIISKSNFNKAELTSYSNELSKMYDSKKGLASAFIIEHKMREATINQLISLLNDKEDFMYNFSEESKNLSKINIKNFYYYRPNETKQLDANYTREQIKNLNISCDNLKNIRGLEKLTPNNFITFYLTENVIGKVTQDSIRSSLDSVYQNRCDTDAHLSKVISLLN